MRNFPLLFLILAFAMILAGCSPSEQALLFSPVPDETSVQPVFTSGSSGSTSTVAPISSFTVSSSSAIPPTLTATSTLLSSPDSMPSPNLTCNRALPASPLDITIPDDTSMTPGETFSKTWRLINAGSCTWSPDYSIVFFSGDLMGAARTNNLGLTVTPGKSVDITLDMTAPPDAGNYQGNWILSDSSGELFGIGPDGDAPFWVRIDVTAVDTSTPTVSPTSTLTPTPGVYTTGLSNLIPGDSIDLDKNQVNDGENDDVRYTSDAEDDHQLIPENGTTIAAFGMTKPTYQDCASATLVADPIKLDSIDQGTYFCFSTHIGLPGWMRLVALNPQDHTLTIEILTWVIP